MAEHVRLTNYYSLSKMVGLAAKAEICCPKDGESSVENERETIANEKNDGRS